MNTTKIIIWGHKLHSHTHSYIHNAYYNTFKKLGYQTFWFDNNDDVSNFNFNDCIFLTEGQVDAKIPLNRSSRYILHHCNTNKYENYHYINLCNYVNDCTIGKSYNYAGGKVEKINYFTYFDSKNKALYQPWATTLFQEEFDEFLPLDPSVNEIYYIGTVWGENINEINKFYKSCVGKNKKLVIAKTKSEEESRALVRQSFISPDVRLKHHVDVGYIPCRVFKNISYGKIPATNSSYIRDFFGVNTLPYTSDIENLVQCNTDFYNLPEVKELFNFLSHEVRKNHTFVNRINHILEVL